MINWIANSVGSLRVDSISYDEEINDVLSRMSGLTQKETDAITGLVTRESTVGNYQVYDEFWGFPLGGSNPLIGFKSKTATNSGCTFDIKGATFDGTAKIDSNFVPSIDGVNFQLDSNQAGVFIYSQANDAADLIVSDGTKDFWIQSDNVPNRYFLRNNSSSSSESVRNVETTESTVYGRRENSTQVIVDVNGSIETVSQASESLPDATFLLGEFTPFPQRFVGSISTFIISGVMPNQAAHYVNIRQFLIDLGTITA